MDIIKLGDECNGSSRNKPLHLQTQPANDDTVSIETASNTSLQITDIKQAVKNQNRVNIFINGKYDFSLDISQLVDFKLKVGQKLSKEELEKYHKASAYGKLYQRTLEWALTRPHSIKETKDYLYRKKAEKEDQEKILKTLQEKKYLNDEVFAKFYVENRFVKKGISRKRLQLELARKGVSKEIAEAAIASTDRTDEDEIKKIIAKKRNKYDDEKLIAYLTRQGFSYQLSKDLVLGTD